eukprot:TRINITY_DN2184_c0_g1_i1.p1 TRINITY_DN2184_c0_g1~~TRINITY_DN2184_c0_g1_i1.p1  ORF type:complete len:542 (-),score=159.92 TRINITY_DN2184_c0_g1_i1:59-1684(-)
MFRVFTKGVGAELAVKLTRGVRVRFPRRKPNIYDQERIEHKQQMKEARKLNTEEFYRAQGQIENKFIDDYTKKQEEKMQSDLIKFRHSIVKIAVRKSQYKETTERKQRGHAAAIEKYLLDQSAKKANRLKLLQVLELDSKFWFDEATIEEKMIENVILPDWVFDHTDYYIRLQEQALLYERGQFDEMDDALNIKNALTYKNEKLIPLYAELVSMIRKYKGDERTKLERELESATRFLNSREDISPQERESLLGQLSKNYDSLLASLDTISKSRSHQVRLLHERILLLYNIIRLWTKYIFIAKISPAELRHLQVRNSLNEEQKRLENVTQFKDYGDALTSASEKLTTQSEDEEELDPSKLTQTIKEETDAQASKPQTPQSPEQAEASSDIQNLLAKFDEKGATQKFEEEFQKPSEDRLPYMYGLEMTDDMVDARDFLKDVSIERLFPKDLIETAKKFQPDKLPFDAEDEEELDDLQGKHRKLNSSVVVEVLKRRLEELSAADDLSQKDRSTLKSIRRLTDKISAIRIDEPRMFLAVFQAHKP